MDPGEGIACGSSNAVVGIESAEDAIGVVDDVVGRFTGEPGEEEHEDEEDDEGSGEGGQEGTEIHLQDLENGAAIC